MFKVNEFHGLKKKIITIQQHINSKFIFITNYLVYIGIHLTMNRKQNRKLRSNFNIKLENQSEII